MLEKSDVRDLIADIFEEEALVIGGLASTHALADDTVWSLIRSLDVIRKRALARLADTGGIENCEPDASPGQFPHPAIEDFLRRLGEGRE